MAVPAAVLSVLVKTQGAVAAASELRGVDAAARGANSNLATMQGHSRKTGGALRSLGGMAKGAGMLVGALGLAKGVSEAVSEYREAQKVGAQTNAVLKSTGGVANVTRKHVENLAGAISKKSGIDDEAIQSAENMLLTFTDVRNEVGKGNNIFDRATQTVTDMSVALGQSGKSSAIQLGKALNDPIKGVTALRRVGVQLTDQQKEQIKTLVEHGDKLGAQKIILKELTREFGGSAAAQATAGDKMRVALGNLAEAAGRVLVPALDKVIGILTNVINAFLEGKGAAGAIIDAFNAVGTAIGQGLGSAAGYIEDHRKDLDAVAEAARNVANVTKWAWEEIVFPIVQKVLPGIQKIVEGTFQAIGGVINVLIGILTLDFGRAWDGIKDIVSGAVKSALGTLQAATGPFRALAAAIVGGVKAAFEAGWNAIKTLWNDSVGAVIRTIRNFADNALDAGRDLIAAVARGVGSAAVDVFGAAKARAQRIIDAVREFIDNAVDAGKDVIAAVARGVGSGAVDLFGAAKERAGRILDAFQDIVGKAGDIGRAIVNAVADGIKGAAGFAKAAANEVIDLINNAIPNSINVPGPVPNINLPDNPIPHLASGTRNFAGGLALVGEHGPELVSMPRGTQVTPAAQTRDILGDAGSGGNVYIEKAVFSSSGDAHLLADRLAWRLSLG